MCGKDRETCGNLATWELRLPSLYGSLYSCDEHKHELEYVLEEAARRTSVEETSHIKIRPVEIITPN